MTHAAGLTRRSLLQRASLGGVVGVVGFGAVGLGATIVPPLLPWTALLSPAFAADDDVAAFAQSVELAVAQAYASALSGTKLKSSAATAAANAFGTHHRDHAAALGRTAGAKAPNKANGAIHKTVSASITNAKEEQAVLDILFVIESALAATYVSVLGGLTSAMSLKLAATILPVEAQHAVVLGTMLGKKAEDLFPRRSKGEASSVETDVGRLEPANNPLIG